MESRGSPVVAPLPEVLKASAEFRAAQGDDGVCALDGPVHASPFEPGADHHFASRLEDALGRSSRAKPFPRICSSPPAMAACGVTWEMSGLGSAGLRSAIFNTD